CLAGGSGGVADQGTGHAVTAATSATKLGARYRDDYHTGLAQLGVGVDVAVVGHDDTRIEGDDVVAIVPLLPFADIGIAGRFHDSELLQLQSLGHDLGEVSFFLAYVDRSFLFAGPQREGLDAVHDPRKGGEQVAVTEGEDRVEVHAAPLDRQAGDDHPFRSALPKKGAGDLSAC